ncbi:MAG TPA: hypothetical protein VGN14_06975 [Candidatus Elarobacter sp.]
MTRICCAVFIGLMAALSAASSAAGVDPGTDCVPIPYAEPIVTLLEPRNASIFDPRGIWIEFSVQPFGQDIRGFYHLRAIATPLNVGSSQTLNVDMPYRLSGDTIGAEQPVHGLWIAHISNPDVASRVSVTYGVNLIQSLSGGHCDPVFTVRPIGTFIWVPSNGRGPFGQRPPLP